MLIGFRSGGGFGTLGRRVVTGRETRTPKESRMRQQLEGPTGRGSYGFRVYGLYWTF